MPLESNTNESTSLLLDDCIEGGDTPVNSKDSSSGNNKNLWYGAGEQAIESSREDLDSSDTSEENDLPLRSCASKEREQELLPIWTIVSILSSAFAYGCIMTTLFLITLPVECERIEAQFPSVPKSVSAN